MTTEDLRPVPFTKENAAEMGAKGGNASGESKRQKKFYSQVYAEMLLDKYKIKTADGIKEIDGEEFMKYAIRKALEKNPATMFKEMREATEGSKIDHTIETSKIDFSKYTKEEILQIAGLAPKDKNE